MQHLISALFRGIRTHLTANTNTF